MSGTERSGRRADIEEGDRGRLGTMLDQLPAMIVVTNARREIRWVNRAFTEASGWTLDEVRGRHPRNFLHGPRTQPSAAARLRRLLDEGQAVNDFELLNYKRSGQPYWVSLSIRPIVDEFGQVTEYVSVQTDITERKQREADIQRTLHRLERAQRLARIGWLEHELASGRVVCSPELLKYFGIDPGRAGDMRITDLTPFTHPHDAERVRSEYAQAINSDTEYESEHRVVTPSGEVRWGHVIGALEGWEDGTPAVFRLVAQDVSSQKEAERLERERDRRESTAHAQTELLARLGSKLSEPLHAVLGFGEMLARTHGAELSARGRALLQQIRAAGNELLRVVDDIDELVGLRCGECRFDTTSVDLQALALEAVASFEARGASRGVTLQVAPEPKRSVVIGDLVRLRQSLDHLIGHAIRHGIDGAQVRLTVQPTEPGWTRLDMCYSGRDGAPPSFDPFGHIGGADEAEGDSGLRLAICKAIVEGMGGTIRAETEADTGTRIVVDLRAASETVIPIGRAAAAGGGPRPASPRSTGSVLCVDDDDVGNVLVEGLLEQHRHLATCFRRSGVEGLAAAREVRPDLILVELQLPDMTGFDFLKQIRADPLLRRVPCVALTVDGSDRTIRAALRAGFRDVLGKPAIHAELLRLVDRLVAD